MKNIVIVGASSGVGFDCALSFAGDGDRVFVLARRLDKLKHLTQLNSNVIPYAFDVSEFDKARNLLRSIVNEYGKIDGVVYCAGQQYISPLKAINFEKTRDIFNVNFLGAVSFLKAFQSKLICSMNNSFFTVISSIASQKPEPGILMYSSSKAALDSFVRGAPKEVSPIRVNALAPGFMKTEMTENLSSIYTPEFISKIEDEYLLGLPNTNDIVGSVKFLASDSAMRITGQVINIDSGAIL